MNPPADPSPGTSRSAALFGILAGAIVLAIFSAPFLLAAAVTGEGCGPECRAANRMALLQIEAIVAIAAAFAGLAVWQWIRWSALRAAGAPAAGSSRTFAILFTLAAILTLFWIVGGILMSMVM